MIIRGILIVLGLLLLWTGLIHLFQWPAYLVPSPFEVFQTIWLQPGLILQETWPTVLESLLGFLVAISG